MKKQEIQLELPLEIQQLNGASQQKIDWYSTVEKQKNYRLKSKNASAK
ncbi:MAG: hypothetical protein JWQ40_3856 [Segetibacter sp.]|nr:hypothetical protein [Segetibacter sp.]